MSRSAIEIAEDLSSIAEDLLGERDALRAENARLLEKFSNTRTTCAYCLATREAPCSPEDVQAHIEECPKHPLKLARADVSRLTKERDEAGTLALEQTRKVAVARDERDTLRARVQELEGILRDVVECIPRESNSYGIARAALESGTGPIGPIGPIEKPIAPENLGEPWP